MRKSIQYGAGQALYATDLAYVGDTDFYDGMFHFGLSRSRPLRGSFASGFWPTRWHSGVVSCPQP